MDRIDNAIFFELSGASCSHSRSQSEDSNTKTRQIGKSAVSFQSESCERLELAPSWSNWNPVNKQF